MKKVFVGVMSTAIVLSMCAAAAFAAGPGCGRYFVDADSDGICDNASSLCAYVDAGGDGICDVCGAAHAQPGDGCCFVDEDEDGICDNYQSGQGRGCGTHQVPLSPSEWRGRWRCGFHCRAVQCP